jgi:hypothetical protein
MIQYPAIPRSLLAVQNVGSGATQAGSKAVAAAALPFMHLQLCNDSICNQVTPA